RPHEDRALDDRGPGSDLPQVRRRSRPPRTWPRGYGRPWTSGPNGGADLAPSSSSTTRGPAMNTDPLAKHYGILTTAERLPLLMAASARGDETEYERLVRSAPKVRFEAPDTFYLAEALLQATMLHIPATWPIRYSRPGRPLLRPCNIT